MFSWGRGKIWITPVLITTCHWFLWEKEYNSDSGLEDSGAAMMYFILTDSQIPWTMADRLIWHLLHVYYSNQVLPWSGRATEASLYWFYNGITSTFSPLSPQLGLTRSWVTRHCLKWLRSYWQIFIKDIPLSISGLVSLQCSSGSGIREKKRREILCHIVKWN